MANSKSKGTTRKRGKLVIVDITSQGTHGWTLSGQGLHG